MTQILQKPQVDLTRALGHLKTAEEPPILANGVHGHRVGCLFRQECGYPLAQGLLHGKRPRADLSTWELTRLDIDIAALSETRLADEGQLQEDAGGFTFFWKGLPQEDRRIHGVGFAIRNSLLKDLEEIPTGVNERLMTLRLKLNNRQNATVISCYAPTLTAEDKIKEKFYEDLENILKSIPTTDKIILLGDFNARVGRDAAHWNGTIGKNGVGNANSNGLLLLSLCTRYELVITNTLFRLKNKYKTTWCHPRSKHWHLLDYVIVRSKDRHDVRITRTMRGADECWTDHRLVRSTMNISLKKRVRKGPKITRRKFNTHKLLLPSEREMFQSDLHSRLSQLEPTHQGTVDEQWAKLKNVLLQTCKSTIGLHKRVSEDWFDENDSEIKDLIDRKRQAFVCWQDDYHNIEKHKRFTLLKAEVQTRVRDMKNTWWEAKAQELQAFADRHDMRNFFQATKALYGPTKSGLAPLKSEDGSILHKDEASIKARWKEHFEKLLNRESTVNQSTILLIPVYPLKKELAEPPSLQEVEKAIKQMNNNKASGPDSIPAEVYKCGGPDLTTRLHSILLRIWDEETLPDDLKNAVITVLYKKGDRSDCGNYRGIALLSSAGKILARMLLNRLLPLSEEILPETQSGFRPSRGTIDMIFSARQIQEKCTEQRQPLFMAFIDLTKAFDSLNREALWKILKRFGCPDKFITILRLLHDQMTAKVLCNGSETESFTIKTGVKQGCILAPTIFDIYLLAVLILIKDRLPPGVTIRYRYDGSIFNLRRLNAVTKVQRVVAHDLQYADDCKLVAHQAQHLQDTLDLFNSAYKLLGLTTNKSKTKVMIQPAPGQQPPAVSFYLDGVRLECVKHFSYLGSTLNHKGNIDDEISHRLGCACAAYGNLRERVFDNASLKTVTKLQVYKAAILPTLLYGCEAWVTYRRHLKTLEQFHQRSLRRILNISWTDYRTNTSVLAEAGSWSIEALVMRSQLRWSGHCVRMPDNRLPKQILYGQLEQGTRARGGQRKRYKDTLKHYLKKGHIDPSNFQALCHNRSAWRQMSYTAVSTFESERVAAVEAKRMARKERQRQRQQKD
ncbi:hypothetical protein Bbelb_052490 [Branchiostoma belcheri]|nr:hypothetical protein Bbelb_052490 [Branchiostoma belcheri]